MFHEFKNSSLTYREIELGLIKLMFAGQPLRSIWEGLVRELADYQAESQDDISQKEQVIKTPWSFQRFGSWHKLIRR